MRDYLLMFEYKAQKEWAHTLMWLEMSIGGVFCGMFVASSIHGFPLGMLISFLAAGAGKSILLIAHLGKPGRFLRVLSRPGVSWLSKGTWGFALFALSGLLTVLPAVFPGIGWEPSAGVGFVFMVIACASAVFVMIYDGFLLAESKGVDIWAMGNLPLLFGANAALGGIGAMVAFWPLNEASSLPASLPSYFLGLSVLSLICIYSFASTAKSGYRGARHSIEMLQRGALSFAFWCGMVVCGGLVPLLAGLLALFGAGLSSVIWYIAGYASVAAVVAARYGILKCGEYSPVL